jgi:predicted Zn-dependent protease
MFNHCPKQFSRWIVLGWVLWLCGLSGSGFAITGAEIYKEVTASTPIYEDAALDAYIKRLGNEIIAQSTMAGETFTFTLLDSPDLNAFATRDNYIYVNRGLLNYVSNEAQLVSVLAHEVAHITCDHVTGQEASAAGAQILSTIAAVLSGSNEVYEAGMTYANSLIRGRGRSNELEADEVGAEYMAKLGYDPQQMLEMLAVMKDYESLLKKRARARGATKQTYHGIFSTHPRNDSRLRTVVTKAKKLQSDNSRDSGAETYRQLTDGLIWGENFLAKEKKPERFSNMQLRIRMDFPKDWQQIPSGMNYLVKGQPEDESASLTLQSLPRTAQTPEEYLYNFLKVKQLQNGQSINPAGLRGFTGLLGPSKNTAAKRIAVIYYKMNAYILTGEVAEQETFAALDKLFMQSIQTFRPISSREIAGQRPKKVHYIQADENTTFASLASSLSLTPEDVDNLRLINGLYPSGEPISGQWIQIFKR